MTGIVELGVIAGLGISALTKKGADEAKPVNADKKGGIDPLVIDRYSGDGASPWENLAKDERFIGAILKSSEGTSYAPTWFVLEWAKAQAAGVRYLGSYHFLRYDQDGKAQAEVYMRQLQKVGWGARDTHFVPCVDFEGGGATHPNRKVSKARAIEVLNSCLYEIHRLSGKRAILYTGSQLRDWSINGKETFPDACKLWTARYSATLPSTSYTGIGYQLSDLFAWQYCGDSTSFLAGYPKTVDGFGKCDINAVLCPLSEVT